LLKKNTFAAMQKSTLSEIVRSLQKKEIREISKWLDSPAHNHRQDVIQLFEHMAKNAGNPEATWDKEQVWKHLFAGEPYDDAFMRQVMYFLLKSIEEYFIHKEYTKEPIRPLLSLASLYRQRHLDKPYRQTIEIAKRIQENSSIRNSDYHFDKFYLEQEQYFYMADSGKYGGEINLQKVSDELDIAFVANKLRLACRTLAHQAVYKNAAYQVGLLDAIIQVVEEGPMLQEAGVAVYYYVYQALTNPEDETNFDKLQQLLISKSNAFPMAELRELYFHALNYCIRRINAGKEHFYTRSYEIYRNGFEQKILIEHNGTIQRMTFNNTVGSGLKAREFEWAAHFIQEYQQFLEEKHRKSVVQFCLARLHFEKGEHQKAQTYLLDYEYDDMLLNVIARVMLLKIYFEQGEYDALESALDAVSNYIRRSKNLSATHKLVFKNTVSVMKKLVGVNIYSKAQVEKFRQHVMDTNPLNERDWFLKQLDTNKNRSGRRL
jgi:hypothetical protein